MPGRIIAIHSKRMLLPEGIGEATLFIENGGVTPVLDWPAMAQGRDLVDADNFLALPGLIDPHVNTNEPARTDWEGLDTAPRAALAGGITLLVDMPLNSSPVTTTAGAFDQKIAAATGKLHCDCGFWGGVVPDNEKDIESLIAGGVLGFKAFLTHSGIDEFPNVTETHLRRVMPVLPAHDLPLLVHCELESPPDIRASGGAIRQTSLRPSTTASCPENSDPRSYKAWLASRPSKWEDDAIALMIRLCAEYRCPTHIVHLSSADCIGPIRAAKERGLPLTV